MAAETSAFISPLGHNPSDAIRARLGTTFSKMGAYRTSPYRIQPHQKDVVPGRQIGFTLPVQSLIDITSFTIHTNLATAGKLNNDATSDSSENHRARVPDGIQTFFENFEIRISGTPISQIMGYNTIQKVKENIYETYDTLRKKNIMEGLFMKGIDARPERVGVMHVKQGPDSGKNVNGEKPFLLSNLHALQQECLDRFGRPLTTNMINNNTGKGSEHTAAMPTANQVVGSGVAFGSTLADGDGSNYTSGHLYQVQPGRAGPALSTEPDPLVTDPIKSRGSGTQQGNSKLITNNIQFDLDENYFGTIKKEETWKKPNFSVNAWRGFLGEIKPQFMDTSLLGPIEVVITLANESILPTFDVSSKNEQISYNSDLTSQKSESKSIAMSTGTVLGRTTREKGEYEFRDLYATVDVIQMPGDVFSDMAAEMANNFELEYLFKDYHTQQLRHDTGGFSQFTTAATSVDHLYAIFRDPNYRAPSPPLRTPDELGKLDDRWYMARFNRFFCPNISSYRFTVNNAHVPMYDAGPMDAYHQLKFGRTPMSAKIQTVNDWLFSFFVLPVRFCFPYSPLDMRSGINTRGMNAAMQLEAKPVAGDGNTFLDVAVPYDNGAGEVAPVDKDGNPVTVQMHQLELTIITEYTASLFIGPGQDAKVED